MLYEVHENQVSQDFISVASLDTGKEEKNFQSNGRYTIINSLE